MATIWNEFIRSRRTEHMPLYMPDAAAPPSAVVNKKGVRRASASASAVCLLDPYGRNVFCQNPKNISRIVNTYKLSPRLPSFAILTTEMRRPTRGTKRRE